MIGGVIVTHGQLANELVSSAEMIVGEIDHITAVSIGWHDDVEIAREQVARAIARLDTGEGVIVLTDMFGGTSIRCRIAAYLRPGSFFTLQNDQCRISRRLHPDLRSARARAVVGGFRSSFTRSRTRQERKKCARV